MKLKQTKRELGDWYEPEYSLLDSFWFWVLVIAITAVIVLVLGELTGITSQLLGTI